jgi:hypothetical protein
MYDATTAAFSWMMFPTNASSSSTGGIPAPRSAAKSVLSDAYACSVFEMRILQASRMESTQACASSIEEAAVALHLNRIFRTFGAGLGCA